MTACAAVSNHRKSAMVTKKQAEEAKNWRARSMLDAVMCIPSTAPKRRGRPPTGRASDSERQAAAQARLKKAGGKRVGVNLSAGAVRDLEAVMAARGCSQTVAIEGALAAAARQT